MNDIFLKEDFLTEINYLRLFIGLIVLLGLTHLIRLNYLKYSNSFDNKVFFVQNIYTFSISITLIVVVIKSSLALSLGLIGALSIIRFRTAIKEPEQIITLLMVMAISISIAAEKEILAIIMTGIYLLINTNKKVLNHDKFEVLVISFISEQQDLDLNHLKSNNINRIYKTTENQFTIEYIIKKENEAQEILNYYQKDLGLKINYEIS